MKLPNPFRAWRLRALRAWRAARTVHTNNYLTNRALCGASTGIRNLAGYDGDYCEVTCSKCKAMEVEDALTGHKTPGSDGGTNFVEMARMMRDAAGVYRAAGANGKDMERLRTAWEKVCLDAQRVHQGNAKNVIGRLNPRKRGR